VHRENTAVVFEKTAKHISKICEKIMIFLISKQVVNTLNCCSDYAADWMIRSSISGKGRELEWAFTSTLLICLHNIVII